jgi:uncharacterized protein (TIGR00661 family)
VNADEHTVKKERIMGTVFYSMAGEGRGHATRGRAIIEEIRKEHRVVIYAPAQAYELLEPLYRKTTVTVRKIPGLFWTYNRNRRLDYPMSAARALGYFAELPLLLRRLVKEIEAERPDLVITDFDPALPRAAEKAGIPYISFDHQHFIVTSDLSSLPLRLRLRAAFMAPAVHMFYHRQAETVVSSFYSPPLRRGLRNVRQIGVLIGKEVKSARTLTGKHLTVYIRRHLSNNLLQALRECGCEVRIYGLGRQPSSGGLKFFDVNLHRFIEDLATGRALLSTAGNQVIGEAFYLGKPVFAIPEPGNFEQEINAHFINMSGGGISGEMDAVTTGSIRQFLNNTGVFAAHISPERVYGNDEALGIIGARIAGGVARNAAAYGGERAVS